MMESNSDKKLNHKRNLAFLSPKQKPSEINQGPFLEPPQDPAYQLSEATDKQALIDQPIQMSYKLLGEQLLAEGSLKPSESLPYHINQSGPRVTQIKPITFKYSESEEDDHQEVENSNKKKPQTLRSKPTRASSSWHSNRSTKSKPLPPRSRGSHLSNQRRSNKTEHDSTTEESGE